VAKFNARFSCMGQEETFNRRTHRSKSRVGHPSHCFGLEIVKNATLERVNKKQVHTSSANLDWITV
jgi:hypothetical protein